MPIDRVSSQSNNLFSTFQGYAGLDWSLIPVRQKIAAVQWSAYQQQQASLEQLRTWFNDPTVTGAAVITGPVSGLMILDFDEVTLFRTFARQYPHLLNTLTVKTRRGYHLYFRVPTNTPLRSARGQGIDLLYSGRYALLPGSVVDGHTYAIQQAASIHHLTPSDIRRIQSFMSQQGRVTPEKQQNANSGRFQPITGRSDEHRQPSTSLETLQHVYRSLTGNGQGRNNALFFTACYGRDHGLNCSDVTTALARLHSLQPIPAGHRPENQRSRYREAVQTIASAFRRPAQPQRVKPWAPVVGLPNSARERLLQQGQAGVIRVIEGLRHQGIQLGQGFTSAQALELLQGIVGRDTVWAVLNEGLLLAPPHPLSLSYGVAKPLPQEQDKKCFLIRLTKSGMRAGTRIFVMPTNTELAAKLGIRDGSLSDPLTVADLSSARNTRMALHREFLKRRPGQYPVKLFATRLGVSVRTIHRYHAADPLFRREMVCDAQEITWVNVDTAMPDVPPHGGCFLMDGRGKKYPCKRPIAQKLLAKKHKVYYLRQRPNIWSYGERQTPLFSKLEGELVEQPHSVSAFATDRHPLFALNSETEEENKPAGIQIESSASSAILAPAVGQGSPEAVLHGSAFRNANFSVMNYQPAVDHKRIEKMAVRLRDTINQMSGDTPDHRMSIGSARRLLDKYGEKTVWRAMKIVETRNNVRKPVGLLATILRSERVTLSMRES